MNIKDLVFTIDDGQTERVHVIAPESTKVKAVAAAGQALLDAHAAYVTINRERHAAAGDPVRLAEEAKLAAQEAGRTGKPVDTKKHRKKIREAEEHLEEVVLEWEGAAAALRAQRFAYLDVLEHNAPALAAEAKADADAGIMALASASQLARQGEATASNALAILAAVGRVHAGSDDFVPRAPRARSGGMGGAPGPWVAEGIESISKAIAYASEILDDLKEQERAAEERAKADAEADAAPDLDEDDDDDETDYS